MDAKKFASLEDVKEYLSGEKIKCLICGKRLKSLGMHLRSAHEITTDDYREMFGIPWRTGLCSSELSKKISKNIIRLMETGVIDPATGAKKARLTAHTVKPRRPAPAVSAKCVENGLKAAGRESVVSEDELLSFVDKAIHAKMTFGGYYEANKPNFDLSILWKRCAEDKKLKKTIQEKIWQLPFGEQGKYKQGISVRFVSEIKNLRGKNMSDRAIAPVMGSTTMTIHHYRKKHKIA